MTVRAYLCERTPTTCVRIIDVMVTVIMFYTVVCSQDEKNQIMTTNVWVTQVSVFSMTSSRPNALS